MNILNQFTSEYATSILFTIVSSIVTAIAGALGFAVKKIYQKFVEKKLKALDEETKKQVAKTVVSAIEQFYKGLHGEEKYQKAFESLVAMLAEKGITISELEGRMLIEAEVAERNNVFADEEQTASVSGVFTGESVFEGELIPDPRLYESDSGLVMNCTSDSNDEQSKD